MEEDLQELYQEVVLEHNKHPRNNREMVDVTSSGSGSNPSCGDDLTVFIRTNDGKIKDVSFVGEGCAISQASASMMTEIVLNKTPDEALKIIKEICHSLSVDQNCDCLYKYNDFVVFKGVKNFPMRIKCATLAWHALEDAINKINKK